MLIGQVDFSTLSAAVAASVCLHALITQVVAPLVKASIKGRSNGREATDNGNSKGGAGRRGNHDSAADIAILKKSVKRLEADVGDLRESLPTVRGQLEALQTVIDRILKLLD